MAKPIISAASHITEPPNTYVDRIDAKFRDRAPHVVRDPQRGDLFVIDGLSKPIPMGLVAAAGKRAEELTVFGTRFEDLHRGGWIRTRDSPIRIATAWPRRSCTRPS